MSTNTLEVSRDVITGRAVLALQHAAVELGRSDPKAGTIILTLADAMQAVGDQNHTALLNAVRELRGITA
jgi:hypothetical protein